MTIALRGAIIVDEQSEIKWYLKCDACGHVDSMAEHYQSPVHGDTVERQSVMCKQCGNYQEVVFRGS